MRFPIQGSLILQLIPQRKPMVMVDALLDYSEETVSGSLQVREENIFVNEGVLQASGLLEHMAQTVAMHTGYTFFIKDQAAPIGYIGSIQKVEIFRLPIVGEVIVSQIEIVQEFMGVTLVNISSKIDNFIIATAQMKTVIASS